MRLNLLLWWLLTVTNAVDILASRRAYELGIEELNPLISMLLAEHGLLSIVVLKGFWLFLLLRLLPYLQGWTQALFACACLAYFALAVVHLSHSNLLLFG